MDELLETLCDNVSDAETAYALTRLAPAISEVLAIERAQAVAGEKLCQEQIRQEETDHLRQRIQELEEARRWIPVSERLPEEGVPVLAISKGAVSYLTTAMLVFVDDGPEWSGMAWAQLCETYQPDLWDKNAYDYDDEYEYTHWQPLPAPPAPGGDG